MRHIIIILALFNSVKFVASFISRSRSMNFVIFNPPKTLLNAKVTPNQGESMDEYRKVYYSPPPSSFRLHRQRYFHFYIVPFSLFLHFTLTNVLLYSLCIYLSFVFINYRLHI